MSRITKLQALIKESDMDELLICDKMSLFYLINRSFDVGERFIALQTRFKKC